MAVLTLLLSRGCQGEAPYQIWWESDRRFRSYSSFCKFQYGGRRPSWIRNFTILGPQACSVCGVDDTCQFWCIQDEAFQSYSILSKFQFFVGGHLGFRKWRFWHFCCLGGVKAKLHTKFGENRTDGSGVILVFCKFQYGGRRPSWIRNFTILGPQACSGCGVDDTCQFWCIQVEAFRSYSIFSKCQFFVAAIMDLEKWRFWHFRCLGGVKAMLHTKFGENRTDGSGVIQVFVNFKMAAGGHLVLWISRFWDHGLLPGAE